MESGRSLTALEGPGSGPQSRHHTVAPHLLPVWFDGSGHPEPGGHECGALHDHVVRRVGCLPTDGAQRPPAVHVVALVATAATVNPRASANPVHVLGRP